MGYHVQSDDSGVEFPRTLIPPFKIQAIDGVAKGKRLIGLVLDGDRDILGLLVRGPIS
jgi:hypothetical protein